jgi:hypothetical protein
VNLTPVKFILITSLLFSGGRNVDGQTANKKESIKKITGTIIAYDQFFKLMPCYHICSASLIVRVNSFFGSKAKYIIVNFSYPDKHFPEQLVEVKKTLTFKVQRESSKDFALKQFVKIIERDLSTGVEKEGDSKFQQWRVLPSAENEKLPFGKMLPVYGLTQDVAELIGDAKK